MRLTSPNLPERIVPVQQLCDWLPYTVNPLYRLGTYDSTTTHATFSCYMQDLSVWLDAYVQKAKDRDAAFIDVIRAFVTLARPYVETNGRAYIYA